MLKACLFATALLTLASVWSVNARAAQIDAHVVYIQAAKLDNLETVAEVHAWSFTANVSDGLGAPEPLVQNSDLGGFEIRGVGDVVGADVAIGPGGEIVVALIDSDGQVTIESYDIDGNVVAGFSSSFESTVVAPASIGLTFDDRNWYSGASATAYNEYIVGVGGDDEIRVLSFNPDGSAGTIDWAISQVGKTYDGLDVLIAETDNPERLWVGAIGVFASAGQADVFLTTRSLTPPVGDPGNIDLGIRDVQGTNFDVTCGDAPAPRGLGIDFLARDFRLFMLGAQLDPDAEVVEFRVWQDEVACFRPQAATWTLPTVSPEMRGAGIAIGDISLVGPGVTVLETGHSAVNENGGTDTYSVVLNTQPTENVTILVTADPTQVTVDPQMLTFTPNDWFQPQTVTVTGVNNQDIDGNRTSSVTHSAEGAPEYDGIGITDVSVAINDDDEFVPEAVLQAWYPLDDRAGSPTAFQAALTEAPCGDYIGSVMLEEDGAIPGKTGTSAFFDNAATPGQAPNYLQVVQDGISGAGSALSWDDDVFSIAFWVNPVMEPGADGLERFLLTRGELDVHDNQIFNMNVNRGDPGGCGRNWVQTVIANGTPYNAPNDNPGECLEKIYVQLGQWNHIAYTHNGDPGFTTVKLYVNGVLAVEGSPESNAAIRLPINNPDSNQGTTSDKDLLLARRPNAPGDFKGHFDDVGVFIGILTQEEVNAIMVDGVGEVFEEEPFGSCGAELAMLISESDGGTSLDESAPGVTDSYEVSLTVAPAGGDTVVEIVPLDDGQLIVEPSSLTFTRSNFSDPQMVTVTVIDDDIFEAPEHIVKIGHTASGGGYDGVVRESSVKILDNDILPIGGGDAVLQAWYPLDDAGGSDEAAQEGNTDAPNGEYVGIVILEEDGAIPGKTGTSAFFDNVAVAGENYMQVVQDGLAGAGSALSWDGDRFSLSYWVLPDDDPGTFGLERFMVSRGEINVDANEVFQMNINNNALGPCDANWIQTVSSNGSPYNTPNDVPGECLDGIYPVLGEWSHIAYTYDGAEDPVVRLFINGVLAATGSSIHNIGLRLPISSPRANRGTTADKDFFLARRPNAPGNFVGHLDDVGIFTGILSQEQIDQIRTEGVEVFNSVATGACCNGVTCSGDITETDCEADGGEYQGDDSVCDDMCTGVVFRRGDCDQSGKLDFNDAIFHLRFLFLGENEPEVNSCRDACDSDDSGEDDFTDDINSLRFLFLGQGDIPAPGPLPDESHPCGADPTDGDGVDCVEYSPEVPCP